MILKTLRRLIGITGPVGPAGETGATGATGPMGYPAVLAPVQAEIRQIQEALGGLWRTQEGDLIPFKLLTDTHIHSILEGGFGSPNARGRLRVERLRRNKDDQWAEKAGNLSQRKRIEKLEFFAKKGMAGSMVSERICELERAARTKDSTAERIEAMAGELLALRRQVKELKNKPQPGDIKLDVASGNMYHVETGRMSSKKNNVSQEPREQRKYDTRFGFYMILTKAEGKQRPDKVYLTPKQHEANLKGHGHKPMTYNERVAACEAGQPKAERTPYSDLTDMLRGLFPKTFQSGGLIGVNPFGNHPFGYISRS